MRRGLNGKIRKARLELDRRECQLSKLFGIAELSGQPCSGDLEVHHKTYERYGHEAIEDVITVCTRCHDVLTDAIRKERYLKAWSLDEVSPRHSEGLSGKCPDSGPKHNNEEVRYAREVTLSDCRNSAPDHAQWPTRQPRGRIRQSDEGDFVEAEEGGCRL